MKLVEYLQVDHTPSDDHIVTIDYITIASTAQTRADFGDLTTDRRNASGLSSPVRGLIAGGQTPSVVNTIEFITLSTLGNSQDFGDLIEANSAINGCFSNPTRGLLGGGSAGTNLISFVTIATLGNATNFGDLTVIRQEMGRSIISNSWSIWWRKNFSLIHRIKSHYTVNIATQGDAFGFGDLNVARRAPGSVSNAHGGLLKPTSYTILNTIDYITIVST